ncbi:MAG: 50S ribosomal protein L10 [Dehalococcoidales bacterium]|nr:50S ribosomal protein L10 [Dehalococcoidales bacterium]
MPTEKKTQIVEEIKGIFAKSNIAIFTQYQGLPTAELNVLRRKLRASNSEYQVVKNTLFRLAAKGLDKSDVIGDVSGPTAVVFGFGEISAPAKVLIEHIRDTKSNMTIKGGFLGDRRLTAAEVATLATLPPREVLLAKVFGQMKSPIAGLLGSLTAPMRGIAGVLQARIKQLEEGQNVGKS